MYLRLTSFVCISIIIVGCLFTSSCSQSKTEPLGFNTSEPLNYKLIGEQYGYGLFDKDLHVFGINFELIALSDSLPPFYLMTCSWSDHTILSDTTFGIGQACDSNFLNRERLNKNDTLRLTTFIGNRNMMREDQVFDLKVALIIVDTEQLNYADSAGRSDWFKRHFDSLQSLPQNQYWSNNLLLKKMDSVIVNFM